jgi:hypothetical protein
MVDPTLGFPFNLFHESNCDVPDPNFLAIDASVSPFFTVYEKYA